MEAIPMPHSTAIGKGDNCEITVQNKNRLQDTLSTRKVTVSPSAATCRTVVDVGDASRRFSTLVKGYCQYGDIDKGFAVLKQMITAGKHEPDEILYNSLLDGCAKQHRVDDALALVEDMHHRPAQPTQFSPELTARDAVTPTPLARRHFFRHFL